MQIQAYLDNVFDVGSLLEDAEAKSAMMEHVEQLQEQNVKVKPELLTQQGTVISSRWLFCEQICGNMDYSREQLDLNV